jgi:hypothetical protein
VSEIQDDLNDMFPTFICEKCGEESCVVMKIHQIVVEAENGYISKRTGLCLSCFFESGEDADEDEDRRELCSDRVKLLN